MVRVRMLGDDGAVLLDSKQHNYGTTSSFKKEEEEHPMERIRVYSKSEEDKSRIAVVRASISDFLHHNHYFHIIVTLLILLDIMIIIAMLILEALQRDGYCIAKYLSTGSNSTKERSEELEKYKTAVEIEHVLHYVSLSVLSVFMLEFMVKIFASGLSFFSHTLEVLDVVVVTVTLLLEVFLTKDAVTGTVGLLLLVRLWRVVHIVTNVTETVNMAERGRVEELQKLVFDLQGEVQRLRMLTV